MAMPRVLLTALLRRSLCSGDGGASAATLRSACACGGFVERCSVVAGRMNDDPRRGDAFFSTTTTTDTNSINGARNASNGGKRSGKKNGNGGPVPLRKTPRGIAASKRKPVVERPGLGTYSTEPTTSSGYVPPPSVSSSLAPDAAGTQHHPTHFIKGGTPCDPAPPPFTLAQYGDGSLYTLVLLRHGESEWNSQNRYTGWCDVNLTERGEHEARSAGRLLFENGIELDHAFTSVLKRASFTTNMTLNMAGQHWVPVTKSWRLNERHYGALQGYNKDTAWRELGIDQELVMEMRRSYRTGPPRMEDDHPYWHGEDRRYKSLTPEQLEASRAESLEDTARRIMPFFNSMIIPSLRAGNRCLVVSHANTLRTLIKQIDGISDEDIKGMSIPTGIPLLYRLDKDLRPVDPKMELEFKYMVEPRGYTWATSHAHGFHGVYLGDLERLQDIQRRRDETTREWQRIILRNLAQGVEKETLAGAAGTGGAGGGSSSLSSTAAEQQKLIAEADKSSEGAPAGGAPDSHTDGEEDDCSGRTLVKTRLLWWAIHNKMQQEGFGNMLLLERMKEHLECMMAHERMYMTMSEFKKVKDKIHLDAEGHVVEPFVSLTDHESREKREKQWSEALAFDLEEHCLIK